MSNQNTAHATSACPRVPILCEDQHSDWHFVNSLAFSSGNAIKYADNTTAYYPLSKSNTITTTNTKTEVKFGPLDIGKTFIDEYQEWTIQIRGAKSWENQLPHHCSEVNDHNEQSTVYDWSTPSRIRNNAKLLGVALGSHLSFSKHITAIKKSDRKSVV